MPYSIKKAKGKDGFYVYGADGKRHSKKPLTMSMAKKQMTALNIAHARKAGTKITVPNTPRKRNATLNPIHTSRTIEKAVELSNLQRKEGTHSPAGILAPLISETTGGGSGLANDARWVSAVKSGGPMTKAPVEEKKAPAKAPAKEKVSVAERMAKARAARKKHEKHEKAETPAEEAKEHMSMPMGGKMTLAEKRKCYVEWYKEGKDPKEVQPDHRRGYVKFYKEMKEGKKPKWLKETL